MTPTLSPPPDTDKLYCCKKDFSTNVYKRHPYNPSPAIPVNGAFSCLRKYFPAGLHSKRFVPRYSIFRPHHLLRKSFIQSNPIFSENHFFVADLICRSGSRIGIIQIYFLPEAQKVLKATFSLSPLAALRVVTTITPLPDLAPQIEAAAASFSIETLSTSFGLIVSNPPSTETVDNQRLSVGIQARASPDFQTGFSIFCQSSLNACCSSDQPG